MREELKQREAELEKSLEEKQQLKNQVQNLKEGLQNLQNAHVMQVGDRHARFHWEHVSVAILRFIGEWVYLFEQLLFCTLMGKKLVRGLQEVSVHKRN